MTSGDTLPPAHCIIDLFSSLGFPDLETGSCRWGSSNCGFFFPPRGVLPTVGSPTQLCHRSFFCGISSTAYRIWKQGGVSVITGGAPQPNCVIDLFLLPRLTEFGNRGWCVCYNRGGDPVNFVIALFPRDWGSNLTVLSMFSCSLGLPNLETGWCVCYNRGAIQSTSSSMFSPNSTVSSIGLLSKPKPRCSSDDQFLYAYCINRN